MLTGGGFPGHLPLAATRSGARHLAAPGRCSQAPDTPACRAPLRVAANGSQGFNGNGISNPSPSANAPASGSHTRRRPNIFPSANWYSL
jgi:hypothetical protein